MVQGTVAAMEVHRTDEVEVGFGMVIGVYRTDVSIETEANMAILAE